MTRTPVLVVLFFSFFLLLNKSKSVVEDQVKNSLIEFLAKLSGAQPNLSFNWKSSSDPCHDIWKGVICDRANTSVRRLLLNNSNLVGTFDASVICNIRPLAASLLYISLEKNNIGGHIHEDISNCKQLMNLHMSGNQFSGSIPDSFPMLSNLKRLDISYNNFSGDLPDIERISGLNMFLAQYNQLTGEIPKFDFLNLVYFNVSFNNFSGPIPDMSGLFSDSSFLGNKQLCGPPSPNICTNSSQEKKSKGVSSDQILMYSGYALIFLLFLTCVLFRVLTRKKKTKVDALSKDMSLSCSVDESSSMIKTRELISSEHKISESKMDITAENSALLSSSLIVLTSPEVNGLKFEDLLRAPAELMGRGKYSSLYKVHLESGMSLAVKRIKDWVISGDNFKERMHKLDQVKHPNILRALAFYCSKHEKLLVYEYQNNGSLFKLLHGVKAGRSFDWASRLAAVASIAEALAFMHQELQEDGIAHGNIKSSNVLMKEKMEACISEYGLMPAEDNKNDTSGFKADVHGLGVIILELLTGKLVQNNGVELTTWVHSVLREEWTVEVFDKSLISEGASEERMVNLLQVAIKCVSPAAASSSSSSSSSSSTHSIKQIAAMIIAIKDEEERYEDRSM